MKNNAVKKENGKEGIRSRNNAVKERKRRGNERIRSRNKAINKENGKEGTRSRNNAVKKDKKTNTVKMQGGKERKRRRKEYDQETMR